ncbi:MAG TPA: hypothetical protein VK149_10460 [Sideroxyarcus sp.]|nr:hypothetical protein [Sideroxyarcus sp.]
MNKYILFGAVWLTFNLSPFSIGASLADSAEEDDFMLGATRPQLAFDDHGNAVVVWLQIDKTGNKSGIWASHYDVAGGWSLPSRINSAGGRTSGSPEVSVDADGSATAVWAEWEGESTVLRVSRYKLGMGWGRPEPISQGEKAHDTKAVHYAFVKKIIADRKGSNFILWGTNALAEFESEMDGSKYMAVVGTSIYINRFDAKTGGWREPIYAAEVGKGSYCEMAVDGLGNVYLLRQQNYVANNSGEKVRIEVSRYDVANNSGEKVRIEVSRYDPDKGLGAPVAINNDEIAYSKHTLEFIRPHIAADARGNVMSVWQQSGSVRANTYDYKSDAWSGSQVIEPHVNVGPEIAAHKNGDLFAAWNAMEGRNDSKIWAKHYVPGQGWGVSKLINDANAASDQMQLAVDSLGNAIIVWRQYGDSSYNIWANRYDVAKGWGEAVLIDVDKAKEARDPKIGFDSSRNAISVWSKWNGRSNAIYANRYVAGKGWLAPMLISREAR